jgi:hypothetical protein
MPSRAATICAYCGEPITIATNPLGQTLVRHFHDWQCYSQFYELERGGEPIHLVSHDERIQDGLELP